jgi:hypothetical protein
MSRKTRLELTWVGKDERPRLEPRILIEDVEKSYHASAKREGDIFDNVPRACFLLFSTQRLAWWHRLEGDHAKIQ